MNHIAALEAAVALVEAAANDWLPLLIGDTHRVPAESGSIIFMAFALTISVGRFAGGSLLERFGLVAVIRESAIVGRGRWESWR